MTVRIGIIVCGLLLTQNLSAEQDTIMSYFPATQQYLYHPLANIDPSRGEDNTQWNYGNEGIQAVLNLAVPDTTYNGSGFTEIIPAQTLFSVDDFPLRTAVNLFRVEDGVLIKYCSGMLVASQYVLTDCHCTGRRNHDEDYQWDFFEGIVAYPAFDNGVEHLEYGYRTVDEYITFASNRKGYHAGTDIALLKLDIPIGEATGWVGIAFNNDDSFFEENIFHEFSYPGSHLDSSNSYNGDTLYYNYGRITEFGYPPWIGWNGVAISGQSGSSLLYTDNEEYFSLGTLVLGNTLHLRITPEIFYSFKAIIEADPSEAMEDTEPISGYYLSDVFPNPFNTICRISFSIPREEFIEVVVYDLKGREVTSLVKGIMIAGKHEFELNMNDHPSGIYVYRINSGSFSGTKKFTLLK